MLNCPATAPAECNTIFDCATSEASLQVFTSDRVTPVAPPYDPNVQYAFRLAWVKCDGERLDGDGLFLSRYDEIDFDGQDNTGALPMNWYLWTPPLNNPAPNYTWGSLTDLNNGDGPCSVTFAVDAVVIEQDLVKAYAIPAQAQPLNAALWETMTGGAWVFTGGNQNLTSITESSGEYWITALHEGGDTSTLNGSCIVPRKEGSESYIVEQRIKFDAAFDHGGTNTASNSGKLGFGLAGGRDLPGNQIVSGGSLSLDGFSFRPGFDVFNGQLNLTVYAYYANRPQLVGATTQAFGDTFDTGIEIVPGQEYSFRMKVEHNDPGVANGVLRVWVDGVEVITQTGLLLMNGTPYTDVNTFGSWHGGDDAFAAPNDTFVRYAGVNVFCTQGG